MIKKNEFHEIHKIFYLQMFSFYIKCLQQTLPGVTLKHKFQQEPDLQKKNPLLKLWLFKSNHKSFGAHWAVILLHSWVSLPRNGSNPSLLLFCITHNEVQHS